MARHFDGTGDLISFGSDASIDSFATLSIAFWLYSSTYAANMTPLCKQNGVTSGWSILFDTVTNVGVQFVREWSGGLGNWVAGGAVANGVRAHVSIVYDGSAAANDPTIYINGVVKTLTTNINKSGTLDDDAAYSLSAGQGSGLVDFLGDLAAVIYHDAVLSADEVNRARYWGRPFGGLKVYHPFFTDKVANEGTAAADATVTNATMAATMVPPVVRPGTAMLGMGIGW